MAPPAPAAPIRPRTAALGFALDLVVLIIFIAAGRQTHEGTGWAGFTQALWPFLTALVLTWGGVVISHRRPRRGGSMRILGLWPVGIIVWIATALGGLTLRAVTGGGISGMFPLVAAGVLGAGFLGWRLVAVLLRRERS